MPRLRWSAPEIAVLAVAPLLVLACASMPSSLEEALEAEFEGTHVALAESQGVGGAESSEEARARAAARREARLRDPSLAPGLPLPALLPESLFSRTYRAERGRTRLVKTLDADQDGRIEIKLVYDSQDVHLLRRYADEDYDGRLDAATGYVEGRPLFRIEDRNADGRPDRWIRYDGEFVAVLRVDRDFDGVIDAAFVYRGGKLFREEHDLDGDGVFDLELAPAEPDVAAPALRESCEDLAGCAEYRQKVRARVASMWAPLGNGKAPIKFQVNAGGRVVRLVRTQGERSEFEISCARAVLDASPVEAPSRDFAPAGAISLTVTCQVDSP